MCGARHRGALSTLAGALAVLGFAAATTAPVRVVTTIPDLADWVSNVGGDRVVVASLLSGSESPHTFEPGPDDAIAIARADMLVKVGLGLEEWLDGLIASAGGKKLVVLDISRGVEVMRDGDDEELVGYGQGSGNPHIWLDPAVARSAVAKIADELGRIDSAGGPACRANAATYREKLDSVVAGLTELVRSLRDRRIIAFHSAFPYFARAFGFSIVASVEPIPGQEPSARQMAGLIKLVKSQGVRVICTEPQLPSDIPAALAAETGARVVALSPLTGGLPEARTYIALLSYNVRTLAAALGRQPVRSKRNPTQ